MSHLDNENPNGFLGDKMLIKTVTTAFYICSYKENAMVRIELHFLVKSSCKKL